KDLASGEQRMIYGDLDMDMQETWAVHGFYPLIDWTPDGNALVLWAGGKLRRVAADGSGDSVIPFSVNDTRGVADAPHPVIPVSPDSFTAKIPRFASVSPDGRTVVFESLGKLYTKPVAGGTAQRLTSGNDEALELWPSWSRDGRRLTYIRWTDEGLGQVMSANANGSGARAVTRMPGHYAQPRFSPDGNTIVFEKRSGGYLTSPDYSENEGIYRVSAAGGTAELVARDTSNPQFGADSDRVFMLGRKDGKLQLLSADLDGEARQVHAEGELATEYHVSPRGDFVAFRENYEVFATPLMPGGQAVTVGEKASSLPVVRASKGGADYIGWTQGGDMLTWTMGPVLYRASLDTMFADAPKEKDAPAFVPPTSGTSLERTVAAAKPSGTVAITGAKILTMAGDGAGAIANGTIVITGDRIAAIGPADQIAVPQGASVIDAAGKTIMPGLVDAHAHGPQGVDDLVPQQNWSLVQNLAMGTTTLHDPSSRASMI
ncbi:MAG TPA: amidohydrolase, partial [Erythrobacter sp.]|nr:amidohydrolase [Erythrobacter sp.]